MVRDLHDSDIARGAELHQEVLGMEFIAQFGGLFLRRYHRAWRASPGSVALVAEDRSGRVVGFLLGSLDPGAHIAGMVCRHGFALAVTMVVGAGRRPRLAMELVRSRLGRYVRGIWRVVATSRRQPGPTAEPSAGAAAVHPGPGPTTEPGGAVDPAGPDPIGPTPTARAGRTGPLSGEITHLGVDPNVAGQGVGRALVDAAVARAKQAGLDELVLVTPPDLPAGRFYQRLGWTESGRVTSRSGEIFVRYRLVLD